MPVRFRFRVTTIVILACFMLSLSVLSSVIIARSTSEKAVMAATADITAQIRYYARLRPGERGTIRIPQVPANELIVLPPYSHKSDIQRELPDHSAAFQERLLRAAASDVTCPALVWAKDDNIVGICTFRPNVAMQLTVKLIDLRTTPAIGIVKERQSLNEFLSLGQLNGGS
jgi:hypothetical protein